jgi:signal transduction histidine kinase
MDYKAATHVIGDHHRLRQGISNFISNSCKFVSEQGNIYINVNIKPCVTIPSRHTLIAAQQYQNSVVNQHDLDMNNNDGEHSMTSASQRSSYMDVSAVDLSEWIELSCSVCDDGAGFSADQQNRLFRAYQQINPHGLQEGMYHIDSDIGSAMMFFLTLALCTYW